MSIRRLFPLLTMIALLLAGCAGATPTAIIMPTMTNVPTVAPTVTALVPSALAPTSASTEVPTAAPTAVAIATTTTDDIVPAGQINAATQARLRLAHLVKHGPKVDLYINGALAVNGRAAQANMPPGYITGYIFLPPGTYHVAVVPTGKGLAQAYLGPLDVTVAAGHRYTLAVIGQVSVSGGQPLVIDDTAAELKAGAVATDSVRIYVANMNGGAGMEMAGGGNSVKTDVPYGESVAAVYPAGNFHYTVRLNGNPGDDAFNLPNDDGYWNEPGTSTLVGFVGPSPEDQDYFTAAPTSELSTISFLQGFSGKKLAMEAQISFVTLLGAIKTAGLTDTLNTGGPYVFFAPTDAAFAALPQDKRDALLADPQALANLLRSLIVPGYFPLGSLSKTPTVAFDRSLTNMAGAKLVIGGGFTINGADTGPLESAFVSNGNQVHPINTVLMPATK